jgi:uncharacterized protein (TIGR04255 family)
MSDIKYGNSPIIEVLCEIQFSSDIWNPTIPGLFYKEIEDEFSETKDHMKLNFTLDLYSPNNKMDVTHRVQFYKKDKTALLQTGSHIFIFNHLKPYPKWQVFKKMFLGNFEKYRKIANPKEIKRIGLRYVNRIDIPKASIEMEEYFTYFPNLPQKLRDHGAFQMKTEIPCKEQQDYLVLTFGNAVPSQKDTLSLLLDFDYSMTVPKAIDMNAIPEWLEEAHAKLLEAFESCTTDKCKDLFRENQK